MTRTRGMLAVALAVLATALPASAMPAGPDSASTSLAPGDQQLVNFAHVYNFTPSASTLDPEGKGTDLELFTADVPKRSYETGELLDSTGSPLPEGSPR